MSAAQCDHVGKLRRTCDVCGAPVQHPALRGRPRRYCDDDCARDAHNERKRRDRAEWIAFKQVRRAQLVEAQGLVD